MENIILIDVGNNIDQTRVNWATESVAEFLSLFPQHKDKIKIQIRKGNEIFDTNGQKIRDTNNIVVNDNVFKYENRLTNGQYCTNRPIPSGHYTPEMLRNGLNQNIFDVQETSDGQSIIKWKNLPQRDDGKYIMPTSFQELEHALTLRDNRGQFIDTNLFAGSHAVFNQTEQYQGRKILATINLTSIPFLDLNPNRRSIPGAFGITSYSSNPFVTLNTSNIGENRLKFRNVLCHELGHQFGATPDGRKGMEDHGGGSHCSNKGCIMEDYFAGNHLNKDLPLEQYFCNDCKSLMRNYMDVLLNEQENSNSTTITPHQNENDLPNNQEVDDLFKNPWRDFANKVKDALGGELEEDTSSRNFSAKIKTPDNCITSIVASSASNVSLSAKKADGTEDIPDLKVFQELAAKASREGSKINFGDIRDNEFKARLLIACMEKNVETINPPVIDDQFLNSLNPASRTRLKLLNQNKTSESLTIGEKPLNPTHLRHSQPLSLTKTSFQR